MIRIGQVWQDNDPRYRGKRRVKILSIGEKFVEGENTVTKRVTQIAVKRLLAPGSHGYTLVRDRKAKVGRPEKPVTEKFKPLTVKMNDVDRALVLAKAKRKPFDGNLSAYLRYVGIHYRFRKDEKTGKAA